VNFYIQYAEEYARVIAAIVLESRQLIPAIKNKSGFEVMDYFNVEIEKVTNQVVPYKIEAENGSLAAYFSVQVTGVGGGLLQKFIRPNFAQFQAIINMEISSFIFNGSWKNDFLFGELL